MAVATPLIVIGLLFIFLETSHGNSGVGKKRVRKVIGGKAIQEGKYPYLASVWRKYATGGTELNFGGVLVRTNWVVLTAHGIRPEHKGHMFVRLGLHNLKDKKKGQKCDIEKLIFHPQFNASTFDKDILLLKLKCTGKRSENVKPANINTDPSCPAVGQTVTVVGWGQRKENDDSSYPKVAHEATLKVFNTTWSLQQFERLEKNEEVKGSHDINTMIFAGVKAGGVDACNGDSGSPLVGKCGNSIVPVGLVSNGYDCARPNRPSIYTRLSAFKDWIDKNIKEEEEQDTPKSG